MKTRLTEILEVEYPIMLAGMGGVSYAELVSAVSEAGGFGCIGASTMGHEQLIEQMGQVRQVTAKPFGVDLLTAAPQDFESKIRDIAKAGASVYVAGLGVPRDVVDLCHDLNLLVVNMCGKVRHAVSAVAAGCDLVVAQGTEAGGHTGTIATFALVPQIVDAVGSQVPVVAAGGIYDGRGLSAALALGADGIWVGTRFIATPEANAVPGYKDRLLGAAEDSTVVSRAYTGKTCRVLRNNYTEDFERADTPPEPFPYQVLRSMEDGANHLGGGPDSRDIDPDREFMPAGQGVGAIDELVPAATLIERFMSEAIDSFERLASMRRPS